MLFVALTHHPGGPRLYIAGRRVHHGLTGTILSAIGLACCWHDRRDARCWLVLRD